MYGNQLVSLMLLIDHLRLLASIVSFRKKKERKRDTSIKECSTYIEKKKNYVISTKG